MANFCIISNNPQATGKYPALTNYVEGTVGDTFAAVRDAVHRGAVLISHPLSGSVKPNESPYKSIVLSEEKGELDFFSLRLIEGAGEVLSKLPKKDRHYSDQVLQDFMVIDLDLLEAALAALPSEYHT